VTATRSRSDLAAAVGTSFKRAVAAARRLRGRETHRRDELSNAQYGLLFGLLGCAERPVGELALLADVSPATATEMLEHLAAAGYVKRARSEHDRRVVLTSLTARGRALIEERRARMEPRWQAALAEFSDEDLLTATAVLERIRELFEQLADEPRVSRD
jgi:DNA-binding MarR family transcriptional regulator